MADSKRYILSVLQGEKSFDFEVKCQKFRHTQYRSAHPLRNQDPKAGLLRSPLCPRDIEIFETEADFHSLVKAFESETMLFDENLLVVSASLTVGEFKEQARRAFPEVGLSKAYNLYAGKLSGKNYNTLLQAAKAKLLERFKSAFAEIGFEHPTVRSSDLGLHKKDIFAHPEIGCEPEVLKLLQWLGREGHLYSQYLAGMLLATSTGRYSFDCVGFLLQAYENEHPEALDLLGRFLLVHDDFLGAYQCGLLSCESGQHHSRSLLKTTLERASGYMVQGGMPASFYLVNYALTDDYKALVTKHTDLELYDPENPPMPAFMTLRKGDDHDHA